ncbi:MAG: tripartite tricarboxylate transporter substrate-binding protein [Betaproteobacteria bacterium]
MIIDGDELRLTQALTNIINNAARYTDPGGSIFVNVSRAQKDGLPTARISVRDTGRGIEPTLLFGIFGMFVQGRSATDRASAGLGVGLALARSIVELHKGTLEGVSEGKGKGAEFVMTIPLIMGVTAPAPKLDDFGDGHMHVMFAGLVNAIPQVRAGKLRAIAVTSAKRSPAVPEVPTLIEKWGAIVRATGARND